MQAEVSEQHPVREACPTACLTVLKDPGSSPSHLQGVASRVVNQGCGGLISPSPLNLSLSHQMKLSLKVNKRLMGRGDSTAVQ